MLSHLECSRDGSRHDADAVQGTSTLGAPLLARYDLAQVAATVDPRRSRSAHRDEGTWVCPEGAACFAAAGQLRDSGWLTGDEDVVVLNTGSGLIYPDTVPVDGVAVLPTDGKIPAAG